MKKKLALYVVTMTLALGIATPAFAQHCDVRKGDSMWKIAKRYHVEFHRVLELNRHFKNQHMIHPKDEIELPDGSTGSDTNQNSSNDNIKEDNLQSDQEGTSVQAEQVLKLVNEERKKQGLKSLTLSASLNKVASLKSKDMRDNNYFSHQSPTYGSPFEMMQQFGITYKTAGENIGGGQQTAQDVMDAWMNSSGHRANILGKNYTELGVGYVTGGSYRTYWTQEFIGK